VISKIVDAVMTIGQGNRPAGADGFIGKPRGEPNVRRSFYA
jgi:hypothetical protein